MRKDLEKLIAITVKGVRLRIVELGSNPRSDSRVQDVPADLLQMWIGN